MTTRVRSSISNRQAENEKKKQKKTAATTTKMERKERHSTVNINDEQQSRKDS